MNPQDWLNANIGQIQLNPDPPFGINGQCVNLASSLSMALGGPELRGPTAYQIFVNFRHPDIEVHDGFAGLRPFDIVFFFPNNADAGTGPAGHVDVALDMIAGGFHGLDTDWNGSPKAEYHNHSYAGVCGYFRIKGVAEGAELTMTPEVKAVLDDLKAHILVIESVLFGTDPKIGATINAKIEDIKAHIINLENKK